MYSTAPLSLFALLAQTEVPDLSTLTDAIDTSNLGLWDYGMAVIILVVAVALGRLARFVISRLFARTRTDDFLGDLIGRILSYVIVAFGFVYSLESLGIAVAPILGALGIVGIALAFALQNILENFVAGIILQLRRPFTAGDEIMSEHHEGTVLEVDARSVMIRTPDGEIVRLPSAEVLRNAIVNHTANGRRRSTIEVGVAYGTDLDRAATVTNTAVTSVDGVLASPAPEIYVESFGDSSIDLAVRYWHAPSIATAWRTRDAVARSIAAAYRTHDIEIPFPQRVLHTAKANEPQAQVS